MLGSVGLMHAWHTWCFGNREPGISQALVDESNEKSFGCLNVCLCFILKPRRDKKEIGKLHISASSNCFS